MVAGSEGMGQPVPGGLGAENPFAGPPGGAFIASLEAAISTAEASESAQSQAKVLAVKDGMEVDRGVQDVSSVLTEMFATTMNSMFNDEGKIESISEFMVNDMGARSKEEAQRILPQLLVMAERLPMKMGSLDKLWYLMMQQKSQNDGATPVNPGVMYGR